MATACGQQTSTNAEPVAQANSLDRYSAQDLKFFERLQPGDGVILKRDPASLKAAVDTTTATVLATPAGVRAGRLLHDLQFVEVDLRVTEVLHGALQPELKGVVRVEFPAAFLPDPIQPVVDQMSSSLPSGPAVWLLRWEGAPPETTKPGAPAVDPTVDDSLYRVVHPNCGVFAQGEKGVVVATAQSEEESGPARGARLEGQALPKLSDLVTRVRRI